MLTELENVPVERLVQNLERLIKERPNDPTLHLNLARTHAMVWATKTQGIRIAKGHDEQGPWFNHSGEALPFSVIDTNDADRLKAAAPHLRASLDHYEDAVRLAPNNLIALLGRAWVTEKSGDRATAITRYRDVLEKGWAVESRRDAIPAAYRTITAEASAYFLPLLDATKDAVEIAAIRDRLQQLDQKGRWVTPIAIPLRDKLTVEDIAAPCARVLFDADGTGDRVLWTWITPDGGWLVYNQRKDPSITSALQLFGNVTFWLFWENGYEALSALDDDGDHRLEGSELAHLGIWRDADSNGHSEPDEVRPLSAWQIQSLSTRYAIAEDGPAEAWSPEGVMFTDGHRRPTWDVLLRRTAPAYPRACVPAYPR